MLPVPPSTTPSCFKTDVIVPKKHFKSNKKEIRSTYSPSSFAFTGISNSSLPLICAHPCKTWSYLIGMISVSFSYKSSWFHKAGLGPITAISPFKIFNICGNSSNDVFLRNLPDFVIY